MWDPYVGRKVVALRDGWVCCNGERLPVAGQTYHIRSVEDVGGGLYIRLMEIVNAPRFYENGFAECAFYIGEFRPLDDRRTDIEVFEKLLAPIKQIAPA